MKPKKLKNKKAKNESTLDKVLDKGKEYLNKTSSSVSKSLSDLYKKATGFLNKFQKDIDGSANKIMSDFKREFGKSKNLKDFEPGMLLAYKYDAKWKKRLKIWDKKPLVISLGRPKNKKFQKTHFYGLNLHYLPIKERVTVATYFLEMRRKRKGQLVYNDVKPWLQKYKNKDILHMYIIKRISPKIINFEATEAFMVAATLKTEKFVSGMK
jgi:hypothetical protein